MTNDYTLQEKMELVNTIYRQIFISATHQQVMSWGLNSLRGIDFMGMVTLSFKVNGFVFKGEVLISYNNGLDLYEIRFRKDNIITKTICEVYCDMLGEILDREIEMGDMTLSEYQSKVEDFLTNSL